MSTPGGWPVTLARAEADGPALTATSRTSILPATAKFTPGPSGFWEVGKVLLATLVGKVTTGTSGTLTFSLGVGSVDAWASQALTMVASQTNQTFELQVRFTCRAVGAGGSATANGVGVGKLVAGAALSSPPVMLPATSPAVGTSFDPAAQGPIDLFGLWSAASTNSLTGIEYTLEALN